MKWFGSQFSTFTFFLFIFTAHSFAAPLQIKGFLDLYAPLPVQNAGIDSERFRLRSGGLFLENALDTKINAFMETSGRDVGGNLVFTINQGYLTSSHLASDSILKIGKFYLGLGILNQQRQSEWAFTTAPKVHQSFFASSNAIDNGLEYTYISDKWNATIGITNGYDYGYSTSNGGQKPLSPTHYLHPVYRFGETGQKGHVGLNYLARTAPDSTLTRVSGLDFSYRLSDDSNAWDLLQGEFYHRYISAPDVAVSEELGAYLFARHGFSETWSVGIRLDAFTTLSLRDSSGGKRDNLDYAFVPVLGHQLSESSELRFSYTHFRETRQGDSTRVVQLIELQWKAEFGSEARQVL